MIGNPTGAEYEALLRQPEAASANGVGRMPLPLV